MKSPKKLTIVLLIALIAVIAASVFTSTATAASNLTIKTSAVDPTVAQTTSYTFTLTYNGNASVTNANITVPYGYLSLRNLAINQQPPSQTWNSTIVTKLENNMYIDTIVLTAQSGQGLSNGQSITFGFDAINPPVAGNYAWVANAVGSDATQATTSIGYNIIITSILPALAILGIAAGIAFLNSGLNRVLINYFIGWEQYRVMQKEMAEFRSESMAAAKANDKKQMEKLKKKQSQINNMQSKMMKPQMVQFGISFVYLIVWFLVLTPVFQNISMAYLPGFGPLSVFYLYPLCSLFLGLLSSRIIGVMPIEQ